MSDASPRPIDVQRGRLIRARRDLALTLAALAREQGLHGPELARRTGLCLSAAHYALNARRSLPMLPALMTIADALGQEVIITLAPKAAAPDGPPAAAHAAADFDLAAIDEEAA